MLHVDGENQLFNVKNAHTLIPMLTSYIPSGTLRLLLVILGSAKQ